MGWGSPGRSSGRHTPLPQSWAGGGTCSGPNPIRPTSAVTTALLGITGVLAPSPSCGIEVSCCRNKIALLARRSSFWCAHSGICRGVRGPTSMGKRMCACSAGILQRHWRAAASPALRTHLLMFHVDSVSRSAGCGHCGAGVSAGRRVVPRSLQRKAGWRLTGPTQLTMHVD